MKIVCGDCGHIKPWWDNHQSFLSCSSCSRLSTCSTCSLWSEKILVIADKRRIHSARKSVMRRKKQNKKRQVVQSDACEDNSFLDGNTTPQGYTAGSKTHQGDDNMGAESTRSISPPGTSYHLPVNQALVNRHQSTSHRSARHRSTSHWSASHWLASHWTVYHRSTRHRLPGTGQPGSGQPVISHLIPVMVTSHRSSSHQSFRSDYQAPGI